MSHSSTITLALAIVALTAGVGASFAAGSALTRLGAVESAQAKLESAKDAQTSKDAQQDLAIAGQGKDLDVIRDTVKSIDKRMERWEERGFAPVVPVRGGGR